MCHREIQASLTKITNYIKRLRLFLFIFYTTLIATEVARIITELYNTTRLAKTTSNWRNVAGCTKQHAPNICNQVQSVSKLIGTHTVLDNNPICKYCCPYILSPPLPPPRSMLSYKSKHFDSSNLMANRTQH